MDRFNRSRIPLLNDIEVKWLLDEYNTTNIDVAQIQFWYEKYKDFRPNTRCHICNKELQHEQVRKGCIKKIKKSCSNNCQRIAIQKTNLERYGGISPAQSPKVIQKMKQTNLERYGVDSFQKTEDFSKKIKETMLERYGVEHAQQKPDFLEKSRNTYKQRTGYDHNMHNPEVIKNRKLYWLDKEGVTSNLCLIDPRKYKRSKQESEIEKFILQTGLVNQEEIKIQDRTILKPLELDILIKSKNLAIEFNGNHQHQIIYKDKNYHLNKTIRCEQQGIRLIHIWYEDYIKNKEYFFNIIKTYLEGKIPDFSNFTKLDRDIFSKLDFPTYIELLPEIEISKRRRDKICRTGFLVKGL